MARPRRFLIRMWIFVAAVFLLIAVLFVPLKDAFMANVAINGLIVGVFLFGLTYNFRQVLMLYPEVAWIDRFRRDQTSLSGQQPPRLLAPMASMLGERTYRLRLSAMSLRSLLDSISARLDESRDLSRYTTGLLIFLGLLGTFWGLMNTVGSIRDVIGGLSMIGAGMVIARESCLTCVL